MKILFPTVLLHNANSKYLFHVISVCDCTSLIWESRVHYPNVLHPGDTSDFTSPWVDVFEMFHGSFQDR